MNSRKVYEQKDDEQFQPSPGLEATGNLLFHIHSTYFKPILFAKEETSLQFYEHVGMSTHMLWCGLIDFMMCELKNSLHFSSQSSPL